MTTLDCGLSWETVASTRWEAYSHAFCGVFPRSQPPPEPGPGTPEWEALLAQVKKLLLQGEVLESRKFRGLAVEFYEGYRHALGLPPGDPAAEVILPWEAMVRHLVRFLEADEDEAHDLVDGAGAWGAWAARWLPKAAAERTPEVSDAKL